MTIASADLHLSTLIEGTVAVASDPEYARAAPWNTAVEVAPQAVVFARSAADIAATVRYAAAVGATVAVAATGHGALPVGPDAILVHTGDMTDVHVDVAARTARVGAGATWQHGSCISWTSGCGHQRVGPGCTGGRDRRSCG